MLFIRAEFDVFIHGIKYSVQIDQNPLHEGYDIDCIAVFSAELDVDLDLTAEVKELVLAQYKAQLRKLAEEVQFA